jgi:hypothetical protein
MHIHTSILFERLDKGNSQLLPTGRANDGTSLIKHSTVLQDAAHMRNLLSLSWHPLSFVHVLPKVNLNDVDLT